MITRRNLFLGATAAFATSAIPVIANAGPRAPLANEIERSLTAQPLKKLRQEERVERRDLRHRKDLRIAAPSIDIQAINFQFGSANIPHEERWKVREIARALEHILHRNPREVLLIEGHTDAVGSRYGNQLLSEERAYSLKSLLVRRFGISGYALETVGYGEDYLLVPTYAAEWRNRRVTLRRVTDFVRN